MGKRQRNRRRNDPDQAEAAAVAAARRRVAGAVETMLGGRRPDPATVAELAAGPPGLGPVVVDDAVVAQTAEVLTSVWQRGWQPVDAVHIAERKAGPAAAAAVVAALPLEQQRYARASVAPAWHDQLAGLGVHPWGDDGPAGPDWSAGHGEERIATLLEALTGLAHLTVLGRTHDEPRLCARPGEHVAGEGPVPPATGTAPDGVLEKVRGLLAKAESTTFPAEAEAFTAKAQELMARHAIDRAMLAASDPAQRGRGVRVDGIRVWLEAPYVQQKFSLLSQVASVNRCRAVFDGRFDFATVMGVGADLRSVELLFTSLLVQATAAMTAAGRGAGGGARSRSRGFRSSFLTAFAHRIGERLREASRAAEQEAVEEMGDAFLPVLASTEEAVERAFAEAFPRLVTRRSRVADAAGWHAGRAAADLATLDPGRTGVPRPGAPRGALGG